MPIHQTRPRRIQWAGAGVLLCWAFCGFSAASQEHAAPPAQTIHVDVNRVNVGVIVTDSKGNFVEGLRREDFQILDNEKPQPVTDFASIDAPGQILLLLEAAPAVYLLRDFHLLVAEALLNGLSREDRVAIVAYNDAPAPLLDFTTDERAAQAALDQAQFNLGYGNLNLARSLNAVLDWLVPVQGKKTIVLLSTGVDTSSSDEMRSLLGRLQTGDVRVLSISLLGPLRNGKQGSKQQIQMTNEEIRKADAWLKTLSEITGGRVFFPENVKAFQEAYREIAEIARHEYSLAFVPPVADGAAHTIEIKVNRPSPDRQNTPLGFAVEHRRAYVAPKPANPPGTP